MKLDTTLTKERRSRTQTTLHMKQTKAFENRMALGATKEQYMG